MRKLPEARELEIDRLGPARFPSPLERRGERFVDEASRILVPSRSDELQPFLDAGDPIPAFEPAGPRRRIFFPPKDTACGLVTCGGLCPGLNNVNRSLVLSLHHGYGVRRLLGFRYGYSGLAARPRQEPMELTLERVADIHRLGGTLLGSSRGPQDLSEMVDTLARQRLQVLFAIGGDGTLKGAGELAHEIRRRGLAIAVVGIPKTIDNDLAWLERSFGFATAVEAARDAIKAAHSEARGAWNGVGLVKLMGRHSGLIAAHATLANSDVNFCLVPEVPFDLDGPGGFLEALEKRLETRRHAVVVVAEGAAQEHLQGPGEAERDVSGNLKLEDVGPFLKEAICRHLERRGMDFTVKYIDPSYTIRSLPANSSDAQYCLELGQHAAHAGMAGRTGLVVGYWNRHFTHVPVALSTARIRQLDPEGPTWQRVLEATGQPRSMKSNEV